MNLDVVKPILVTSGEPSGIGPDICLDIVQHDFGLKYKVIVVGDIDVLRDRAQLLNRSLVIEEISDINGAVKPQVLQVLHTKCRAKVVPGVLNLDNSAYVLNTLDLAINLCKLRQSNIIVTSPVNKEVINNSGVVFSGHTEYFASKFNVNKVIMMLANKVMRVALLTTHLPLKDVPNQVTSYNLDQTLTIVIQSLQNYGIANPRVAVCGLNPHAGEGGYLGFEEINIINPLIKKWQDKGFLVSGSYPADTIFLQAAKYDVILTMYHDQGLPVLKYSGFETGINVTLGLPIIRTSVDHGTALDLSGSGYAKSTSLIHAIQFAIDCDSGRKLC